MFKKVKKEEFEHHKSAVQAALNTCKQDILHISQWVKHLKESDGGLKEDLNNIKEVLETIKEEVDEIKNKVSSSNLTENARLFKQPQTAKHKQTAVYDVQNAVQTTVQAAFFNKISISEKALVGILLNSELKLSYEDLATMTGKDSTTIRGQVNSIRQKAPGLIEEQIEKNNKKRVFIPEKVKEILLKRGKVRVKKIKTNENFEENE
jgi:argininosuccinate lyase